MAMLGGSGTLSPLSKLVDFLSDPAASKAVLDKHIKAAEEHKQAAADHREAEADAKAALEAQKQHEAELDFKSKNLEYWENSLQAKEADLASKLNSVEELQKRVASDQDSAVVAIWKAKKDAEDIVKLAKDEAAKVSQEAKRQADLVLAQAKASELAASKKLAEFTKQFNDLNIRQKTVSEREDAVTKREKAIASLANLLK